MQFVKRPSCFQNCSFCKLVSYFCFLHCCSCMRCPLKYWRHFPTPLYTCSAYPNITELYFFNEWTSITQWQFKHPWWAKWWRSKQSAMIVDCLYARSLIINVFYHVITCIGFIGFVGCYIAHRYGWYETRVILWELPQVMWKFLSSVCKRLLQWLSIPQKY